MAVQVDDSDTSHDENEDDSNVKDDEEEEEEDDEETLEDDDEEELEEGAVDQNFRLELMKVLQQQNALVGLKSDLDLHKSGWITAREKPLFLFQATEDGSSDEDLDDEAMMELDKSLAAVFLAQKKKNQAKKDEKTKIQREKTLVRDFKIKVCTRLVLMR